MLIKYKIKLEANGLTITQHIESGSQAPPVKNQAGVTQHQLGSSFVASTAHAVTPPSAATGRVGGGDGAENPGGPGGGGLDGFGSGPVTIIGPIILTCPSHSATSKDEPEVNNGK